MKIPKYTLGMGDRFGRQGEAQLGAVIKARECGLAVYPVWNKSNREHNITGTEPASLRAEADAAVARLGWKDAYFVDADHVTFATVGRFVDVSDFFTIDVADCVGRPASDEAVESFLRSAGDLSRYSFEGVDGPLKIDETAVRETASKYLSAVEEAGRIFRHIESQKQAQNFVVEVSMDETDSPQSPIELLLILKMISLEGIPAQTIAPKFTGRFNKGVDYVGNLQRFEQEFENDLMVIAHAVKAFGLPETLKLSVHSGSDKFSLYPIINRLVKKHSAGLHLKTAGTTWLEEVIGLAEAGGEGLLIAKEIYARARAKATELIEPYAPVVDITLADLPEVGTVESWDSGRFVSTLRHDLNDPFYSHQFRQFMHVSFKIAAQMGSRYLDSLEAHKETVGRNVAHNLFQRHLLPIFGL